MKAALSFLTTSLLKLKDPATAKFKDLIQAQEEFVSKFGGKRGVYLEFGTYAGNSAMAFHRALHLYFRGQIPHDHYKMYLFDSFIGLPSSDHPKDKHPSWEEGVFGIGGSDEIRRILTDENDIPEHRYEIIAGFYEETLPIFRLPDGIKAGIVNMDCDYYTSTKEALRFLKPYLQPGTLFYFDDLHSFLGNPNKGQLAAINEFNDEDNDFAISLCPYFFGKYQGRIYWSISKK